MTFTLPARAVLAVLPLLVAAAALLPTSAAAAPGDLDPSFGTAGRVGIGAVSRVQVEQQGDRLVVATRAFNGSSYDILVRRFTSAGVLDTSFGTGGTGSVFVGSAFEDSVVDMVLAADGDIVVAGLRSSGSAADVAVGRLTADGVVDATFGTAGFGAITQAGAQSVRRAVALADGRVVVLADESLNGRSSLYAFTAAGTPDATFGGDGIVEVDLRAGNTTAYNRGDGYGLAVDHQGRIVVAGSNSYLQGSDVAVARYLPTGVIDTGFGNLGATIHNLGYPDTNAAGPTTPIDYADDVAVAADGTILTFGRLYWQGREVGRPGWLGPVPHAGSGMALARFSATGAHLGTSVAPTDELAPVRMAQGADGAVYGVIDSSTESDPPYTVYESTLVRITPAHAFDPAFGGDGFASARIGAGPAFQGDKVQDIEVQADGRVVLGGITEGAGFTYSSGLVRLLADAGPPLTPTAPDPNPNPNPAPGPGTPAPTPTAPAPVVTPNPPADTTAPFITASIPTKVTSPKAGLLALGTLSCPRGEPSCTYSVQLTTIVSVKVGTKPARKTTVVLGTAKVTIVGGAAAKPLRIQLNASARARLVAARTLRATLAIEVRDALGNKRVSNRTLTLVAPPIPKR